MANVTIDAAAVLATCRGMRSVVWTTPDIGYIFFIDDDSDFKYKKSTNGGSSWGSAVTIFTGTAEAFDVWFDKWTPGDTGTIIHTWYIDSAVDDVWYRQLDTNGDSLGTQRQVLAITSAVGGVGCFVTGAKARGGNLLCMFDTDAGAEHGTYRSTDSGTTWGVRTNMMEATVDRAMMFPGNEADNQDMWAIFLDASADAITLKVHDDSANTNSESTTIATVADSATDGNGQQPWGAAMRHTDNHLILALCTELDTATGDFRVFDINGTGSITEKTAIATNIDDIYYPSVFVDDAANIYVAYIGKRDGSEVLGTTAGVYYTRSTDGGANWTSGDTAYSTGTADWRQTWCAPNGPRFSVVWRDTSSQELLTNFDNSLAYPLIIDVESDEDFNESDTNVTISGGRFEASQGTGKVELCDNAVYASGTKVQQTVTSWANGSIDFTATLGSLLPGQMWIFVTNNTGERTAAFVVTVHRAITVVLSASGNISAGGGDATTVQLTPPAGKSTSDFVAGKISDDTNPLPSINITTDDYTEVEFAIEMTALARYNDVYEFRITIGGVPLDSYPVTPQISVSKAPQPMSNRPLYLWRKS